LKSGGALWLQSRASVGRSQAKPAERQTCAAEASWRIRDIGASPASANRSLLAARSMEDLVAWSGGLYQPPAKFRSCNAQAILTTQIAESAGSSIDTRLTGRQALFAEAQLTPKPGLVDRAIGSHTDLSLKIMIRSACRN